MTEQMPLHKMSSEEVHDLAYELVTEMSELRDMQKEFASVKKTWSEDIKDKQGQINEMSRILKEQETARRE
jgi:gas vesicle protein